MKTPPMFCLLAGALALTLAACGEQVRKMPAPEPTQTAASTPTPTPEPTPTPFQVQRDDVPPGDYAPWQEAYAEFLRDLRQRAGALWAELQAMPREECNNALGIWEEIGRTGSSYCLYDVDKDGIPEMFVEYGTDEADYHSVCYIFREGKMTAIGDFHTGHASLCTWPGENGALYYRGHMKQGYVERLAIVDGEVSFPGDFIRQAEWDEETYEYTDPGLFVPGSERIPSYLIEARWRPGDCPALTLPVYDYGAPVRQAEPCLERPEVQEAIGKMLWEGEPFFGVSGDGFNGYTGPVTLAEYPLSSPEALAWADVNGDGQEDCILREGSDYAVLALEGGQVYGYYFGYGAEPVVLPDGSVYFRSLYVTDSYETVRFYKNQCYTFYRQLPVEGDGLAWDEFPKTLDK